MTRKESRAAARSGQIDTAAHTTPEGNASPLYHEIGAVMTTFAQDDNGDPTYWTNDETAESFATRHDLEQMLRPCDTPTLCVRDIPYEPEAGTVTLLMVFSDKGCDKLGWHSDLPEDERRFLLGIELDRVNGRCQVLDADAFEQQKRDRITVLDGGIV